MGERKTFHRNDILLFAGLLAIGAILFVALDSARPDGARVDVYADGKVVESYPLSEDREVGLGYNGHNRLAIKGGQASVTGADCPDKLCVRQKAISKEGEAIVCLPHRLVVKISGGEKPGVDGAVQ